MAIAGAAVTLVSRDKEQEVAQRLDAMAGVEVQKIGPGGIAVVIEAEDMDSLKDISGVIQNWDDVVSFQLGYVNWEDEQDS